MGITPLLEKVFSELYGFQRSMGLGPLRACLSSRYVALAGFKKLNVHQNRDEPSRYDNFDFLQHRHEASLLRFSLVGPACSEIVKLWQVLKRIGCASDKLTALKSSLPQELLQ